MPGCRDRPLVPAARDRGFEPLLRANHGVLGGGSERAVRLSAIAPHASAESFPRHSFANLIDDARTIAVRNDPWIRHPDVKRVFTFLNITWIHGRKSDTNPNFARTGCASSISPRTSTSPAAPCLSYQAAFISSHGCSHAKEDSVMSAVVPFFFRYAGPVSAT